jgi:hydroxymethylbilane synthase
MNGIGGAPKLVVASRRSALARLQSYNVGAALKAAWPHLEIEYLFKESLGDKNLDAPLWQMPEKGVFTRDLQEDLEAGRCDMVVHSWKDLPLEMPEGSEIAATLEREDPRDMLLIKRSFLNELVPGASVKSFKVLSSSPRRAYNLETSLKELIPFRCDEILFEPIRGNVPTRVAKLLKHPEAGALILARAALERLLAPCPVIDLEVQEFQARLRKDLLSCEWMILPLRLNPTAAAQGALAVEIRKDREDLRVLLEKIQVRVDFEDVQLEREVLGLFGGGCHQKIGVSVFRIGDGEGRRILVLKGQRDSGELLDFEGFADQAPFIDSARDESRPETSQKSVWSSTFDKESSVFNRVPVELSPCRASLGAEPLVFVVGRIDALPENWTFVPEDRVFASGLMTWKKLAARGIWVHASFEGRGEERLVSRLLPETARTYKFSHADAPVLEGEVLLPTYRLEPVALQSKMVPDGVDECFWSSASLFNEALRRDPDLLKRVRRHSSGPGHTHSLIKDRVRASGGVAQVYLGLDHWRSVLNSKLPSEKR